MTVWIRLEARDHRDLDAHETALRTVLDITYVARNPRVRPGSYYHRNLESTGVTTSDAASAPSPLAVAEDAKTRRDLIGELSSLTSADDDLRTKSWTPLRPGDVVLSYLPGKNDVPELGETYLAVDDDADLSGHAMVRLVSATYDDDTSPTPIMSFYSLWFEAGPNNLVVIRAGTVVHGTPAIIEHLS
jgi:hypothetical protein